MAAKKKVEKGKNLLHFNGVFIDPENVGSSIRYSMETKFNKKGKSHFECEVAISDCDRIIKWSGNDWNGGVTRFLRKIDKAVKTLQEIRQHVVEHQSIAEPIEVEEDE